MTAINHALTGATIGLIVKNPVLAFPIAFLSHFVCDAIPHFGAGKNSHKLKLTSKAFKLMLVVDGSLCILLVAILFTAKPDNYFVASLCAFLATSPDLVWINKFIRAQSKKTWRPSMYSKFASVIQWFEKPIGAVVEVAWGFAAILILSILIK